MYIFSGRVTLRVVHTSAYSCDTAAATPKISLRVQLIFFLTFPYYSKIRKIVRKYILYYVYCYMVYTRLRVRQVAVLRHGPFSLYLVLLRVIHIGRKSRQYTSVLPSANTANVWGSIVMFILEVYHRVQTNDQWVKARYSPMAYLFCMPRKMT